MKGIDWKVINVTFWVEIVLAYVMPFKVIDDSQCKAGFPMPFVTVYNAEFGTSPLMSTSLNPFEFALNGFLIYLVVSACVKVYRKYRRNEATAHK